MTDEDLKDLYLNSGLSIKEMLTICNLDRTSFYRRLNKLHIVRNPTVNVKFDSSKIDPTDPIFSYYVGWIASDGYIDKNNDRVSLRIDSADESVLLKFADHFSLSTGVRRYRTTSDLTIPSKLLVDCLISNYSIPRRDKTFGLVFPKHLDVENMRMYLRGLIEGDGCIRKPKRGGIVVSILNASEGFIEALSLYCINCHKIKCKVSTTTNKKVEGSKYWYTCFTVDSTEKLLDFIYTGYDEFRLDRKYGIYKGIKI